uniref:Vitamin K-dependent protein C n=1 Tax=Salmo trutta TaxID=8032 RepID=A0A674EUZ9_SALTR
MIIENFNKHFSTAGHAFLPTPANSSSILGSTLFSVYINDVALAAGDSLIHLYADDTILYTSGPSLDTVLTNLQTSFNAIQHSFCGLQLLLNVSKTKCMLFNRSLPAPARPTSITTLDGSDLEYVDIYKYLGVWLDCKLSFQTHIKHLQSKIKSRIGFLFRNKASFTHAAKLTLVKLTILPILNFYKIASNTLLSKVDAVYHSAIRFVTKAPYTTHHCDLYALVGWPRYIFVVTLLCGRPMVSIEIHQRILGGEVAPKGTFPWQMLLSMEGGRSGGMVIGDRWILTAAHGLVHQHNNQVIKKSEVMAYVGDNNVENLLQSPPLEVASLHPHPGYNNTDGLSFNHDIALIKLQHPLTFSSSIMRVCLPEKDAEYSTGRVGWVSGFGLKDDDEMPSNLRYVRIPLVDQVKCRSSIDEARKKKREAPDLTDGMFCAGLPEGGKDTCAGDGGGPYVLKYGGVFWAAGIASWGIDCGEPGQYGVYTRIANYVEWIKKTMEEN